MTKTTKILITAFLLVFGTWFLFTPYIAVNGMKSAAEARDAAKLSSYVNFPALKESLKASFNAKLASEVTKEKNENPFTPLGAMMAAAFINPLIDALVTPESLAMMIKGDKPLPGKNSTQTQQSNSDADIAMSYEGFDRFVVTVKKKGETGEPVALVFNRDGMFSWKLSAIRLPL
jgi:hypothetical protein